MIVDLAEPAANAALNALSILMNNGAIELLSSEGDLLCELQLSNPATQPASDGALIFNAISPAEALTDGIASTARIVGRDGGEIFLCDIGDENSDAVIRLSSTVIAAGGAVTITEFRLVMP